MKVKDLQFARFFISNHVDLPSPTKDKILSIEIDIKQTGEPDSIINRDERIVYHNSTSITKFIFQILYTALSKHLVSEDQKDRFGLGLMGMCREYVYADYKGAKPGPPVVFSFCKLGVPHAIISELVEPIMGKIDVLPVFAIECKYTDTCRILTSHNEIQREYGLPREAVNYSDLPLLLMNQKICNNAAKKADITAQMLFAALGNEKATKVIKSILLDENGGLLDHLYTILKILEGNPVTIVDFVDFLKTNVLLTDEEREKSIDLQDEVVRADSFLREKIKVADQSTQVFKQWEQMSMLMGLTEKQLGGSRGSFWPTTEALKPIEDIQRKMITDRTKNKGSALNFEELLEISREMYNHKAKPGTLIENLLRDNRVWK